MSTTTKPKTEDTFKKLMTTGRLEGIREVANLLRTRAGRIFANPNATGAELSRATVLREEARVIDKRADCIEQDLPRNQWGEAA